MEQLVKYKKYLITALIILILPIIIMFFNASIKTILYLGRYTGTFIRNLFYIITCFN